MTVPGEPNQIEEKIIGVKVHPQLCCDYSECIGLGANFQSSAPSIDLRLKLILPAARHTKVGRWTCGEGTIFR